MVLQDVNGKDSSAEAWMNSRNGRRGSAIRCIFGPPDKQTTVSLYMRVEAEMDSKRKEYAARIDPIGLSANQRSKFYEDLLGKSPGQAKKQLGQVLYAQKRQQQQQQRVTTYQQLQSTSRSGGKSKIFLHNFFSREFFHKRPRNARKPLPPPPRRHTAVVRSIDLARNFFVPILRPTFCAPIFILRALNVFDNPSGSPTFDHPFPPFPA